MTNRLQFRIRPLESLLDIDLDLIETSVSGLSGVQGWRLYDDRASDATFVTLVVEISTTGLTMLEQLRSALMSLPRMSVSIVDHAGEEANIVAMDGQAFIPCLDEGPLEHDGDDS